MNCYYHNDKPAVAQCVECGKGLCVECASKRRPVICDDCASAMEYEYTVEKESNRKKFRTAVGIAFIIGCIVVLAEGSMSLRAIPTNIFGILMFTGVPYGWRAFNRYESRLNGTFIVAWLIYYALKVTFSLMLGWLIMLISLFKYRTIE